MAQSVFYDGHTATAHLVEPQIRDGRLLIINREGRILADWVIEKTSRLRLRENEGEFCLTLGGVARLILCDPNLQDLLVQNYAVSESRWSRDKTIIALCLASLIAFGLFLWQGVPFLIKPIVTLIPKETEYALGKATYQQLIKQEKVCHSTKGNAVLAQMNKHLFASENLKLKITVLNSKIENAIALPGGFIIIFRGLLDKAHSPAMLAAVLTHEAGHVASRHGLQLLVASGIHWAIYAVLTSDIFSIPAAFLLSAVNNRYTRAMEEEADRFSAHLMERKKIDPKPLADWFRKMDKRKPLGDKSSKGEVLQDRLFDYFQTHANPTKRARFFTQKQWEIKPSLSPQAWVALKNICADA